MANYRWRAYTSYGTDAKDCDGETLPHGVSPDESGNWRTATIGGGTETHTYEYYYSDATAYCVEGGGCFCKESSSKVYLNVTETWTTSYNATTNMLTISVHTVLNSVRRADVQGRQSDLYGRKISIYRGGDGVLVAEYTDDPTNMGTNHYISAVARDLGTQTISIPPGNVENGVSTLRIYNSTFRNPNYDPSLNPDSASYDEISAGTQFSNILPEPTTYTLSYNANGGAGAPSNQTGSTGAGSYTFTISSTRPTHSWWDFLGWSTSSSATSASYQPGGSITLQQGTPSQTLYAVWDKSYIPGQIWNGSSWMSHDRANRTAGNWNGSSYRQMRTKDGATASGDPPEIQHSAGLRNMRRIGNY